jgi:hypothetical protein
MVAVPAAKVTATLRFRRGVMICLAGGFTARTVREMFTTSEMSLPMGWYR